MVPILSIRLPYIWLYKSAAHTDSERERERADSVGSKLRPFDIPKVAKAHSVECNLHLCGSFDDTAVTEL